MSDLKPCMCCESNDIEIITYEEKYHTRKIATCMDCGARGSVCDSKEEAIEAWNTRPAEDALQAEIERLKGEVADRDIEGYAGFMIGVDQMKKTVAEKDKEIERLKEALTQIGIAMLFSDDENADNIFKLCQEKVGDALKKAYAEKLSEDVEKMALAPDTNVGTAEENK